MALTAAQVIAQVRIQINDVDADRYGSDSQLLGHVIAAVNHLRINRPDQFVGRWSPAPFGLSDPLPVDETLFMGLVHFVTALAELRDDEYASNGRAATVAEMAVRYLG